jgi:hypothetical protein
MIDLEKGEFTTTWFLNSFKICIDKTK